MHINFPFFALRNGSGYYCGEITYDKGKSILRIEARKTITDNNILYLPTLSPSGIDTGFLSKLVDRCKKDDNTSNAIVAQHYILEHIPTGRGSQTMVHNIVIAHEATEEVGERNLYLNYLRASEDHAKGSEYHIVIISPNEYSDVNHVNIKIRGQELKLGLGQHLPKSTTIDDIGTWPVITSIPVNLKKNDISKVLSLLEAYLLEVLLGSIVYFGKKQYRKQLPQLIPTSLLSKLHHTVQQQSSLSPHPAALPSGSYIFSGGVMLEIDLSNLFDKLSEYLAIKLFKAFNLLTKSKFAGEIVIDRRCSDPSIEITDVKLSGSSIDLDVSPEAILKAVLDRFLVVNVKAIIHGLGKLRGKPPHGIFRINVPIPARSLGFYQLGMVDGDVYVAYETMGRRTSYLKDLFSYIRKLRDLKDSEFDYVDLVLASLLLMINDKLGKYGKRVSIEYCILARRMAVLLLEYGLHSLAHLLLRYLQGVLKVPKESLRELVVLSIGLDVKGKIKPSRYYTNVVIGGSRYRLLSSMFDGVRGLVAVVDMRPYTYRTWESIVRRSFDLREFIDFAYRRLGRDVESDECLRLWREKSGRVRAHLGLSRLNIGSTSITLRDVADHLKAFMGGTRSHPGISLPLLEVRVIVEDVIEGLANRHGVNDNLLKQLKQGLRPHREAIYMASTPFCFDGCYNCVLVERSCLGNLLMREWVVSKSMARLILGELERGLS
ncbi:MAG: hypothetical protein ACO2O2_11340 [Acidilobaceae archaeon]